MSHQRYIRKDFPGDYSKKSHIGYWASQKLDYTYWVHSGTLSGTPQTLEAILQTARPRSQSRQDKTGRLGFEMSSSESMELAPDKSGGIMEEKCALLEEKTLLMEERYQLSEEREQLMEERSELAREKAELLAERYQLQHLVLTPAEQQAQMAELDRKFEFLEEKTQILEGKSLLLEEKSDLLEEKSQMFDKITYLLEQKFERLTLLLEKKAGEVPEKKEKKLPEKKPHRKSLTTLDDDLQTEHSEIMKKKSQLLERKSQLLEKQSQLLEKKSQLLEKKSQIFADQSQEQLMKKLISKEISQLSKEVSKLTKERTQVLKEMTLLKSAHWTWSSDSITMTSQFAKQHGVTKLFVAQNWTKVRNFSGAPRISDFQLNTYILPSLKPGEILLTAVCWPVMMYQKSDKVPLGAVMIGEQLASVALSNNPDFPVCSLVVTTQGWRSKVVLDPKSTFCWKVPDGYGGLPPMLCMSTLGLTGLMVYFGFTEICLPRKHNIVLVNSSIGFVGDLAGQLAVIKGCVVIVFTSSASRADWLRKLNFKMVFDYTRVNPRAVLEQIAPEGVDIYIDTVGAKFTELVLPFLRTDTRTLSLGYTAGYCNNLLKDCTPDPYTFCSMCDCRFSTHSVFDFNDKFEAAQATLLNFLMSGKIKFRFRCDTEVGFQHLPKALKYLADSTVVGIMHVVGEDYNRVTRQAARVSLVN